MKKILIIISIVLVSFFVLLWIGSLLKCEILTYKHRCEFADLYQQTNMIDDVDFLKVIDYSDTTAQVYYVSKGTFGILMIFNKEKNEWLVENWRTVWSEVGSADGFLWPYIR